MNYPPMGPGEKILAACGILLIALVCVVMSVGMCVLFVKIARGEL